MPPTSQAIERGGPHGLRPCGMLSGPDIATRDARYGSRAAVLQASLSLSLWKLAHNQLVLARTASWQDGAPPALAWRP